MLTRTAYLIATIALLSFFGYALYAANLGKSVVQTEEKQNNTNLINTGSF